MDYYSDVRRHSGHTEFLEIPHFNGCIHKRVVTFRIEEENSRSSHGLQTGIPRSGSSPHTRDIGKTKMNVLASAIRHVEENHRWIYESVIGVQLGRKRPNFIPVARIANGNNSMAGYAPCLLVHFFHRRLCRVCKGLHPLNMAGKIPNLIERIPCRYLHQDFAVHVGNRHRHMKKVLLWMVDRHFVPDRRPALTRPTQCAHQKRYRREDSPASPRFSLHLVFASEETCTGWPSLASNFSQSPSKLPFDITKSTSPDSVSLPSCSAIASALGNTLALFPNSRTLSATASGSRRFSSPSCCARKTPPKTTRSASASATGSVCSNTFRRIEFERGSRIAHSRRPGQRARAASTVARTAVGWCAKSSTTRTPRTS